MAKPIPTPSVIFEKKEPGVLRKLEASTKDHKGNTVKRTSEGYKIRKQPKNYVKVLVRPDDPSKTEQRANLSLKVADLSKFAFRTQSEHAA